MTPGPFRPGEPLRASDLSRVAGEAASAQMPAAGFLSFQNGAETVVRNPRRNHSSKRNAAVRPRPFACRIGKDTAEGSAEGAQALFCYLPPETAGAVRFRGAVVPTDQSLGTAQEPWVRLGPAAGFDALYLAVEFETFEREVAEGVTETDFRATGWTLSTSAETTPLRWPHLVWVLEEGVGAVQHHLGSLSIGDPAAGEQPDEGEEPDPCEAADDEKFPSDIDDIGPPFDEHGDHGFPGSNPGDDEDNEQFPSKVDVCW